MSNAVVTVALAPDAVGTMRGWRAWRLARARGGRFVLRPLFHGAEAWPAGEPARATCHHTLEHPAPDAECGCGLYAVPEPGLLPGKGVSVVGTVHLWGKVVEHQHGFRGELGYPEELRLVCARCGKAGDPRSMVVRDDPHGTDTLVAACSRHIRGRRRPSWTGAEVLFALLSAYRVRTLPDHAADELRGWRAGFVRTRDRARGAKVALSLGLIATLVATLSLSLGFGLLLGTA